MAQAFYDLTADEVLKFIRQYQAGAGVVPSTTDLGTTGTYLMTAAARVGGALRRGGYGQPTCSSTVNPDAYYIIRAAIASLAALLYLDPLKERFEKAWASSDKTLRDFESGVGIGEVEVTEAVNEARWYHGEEDDDEDVEDTRFRHTDKV